MCLNNAPVSQLFRSAVNQIECCKSGDNIESRKKQANITKKEYCNVTINVEIKNDEINHVDDAISIETLNFDELIK